MNKIILILVLLFMLLSCESRKLYPEKRYDRICDCTIEIVYDDDYQLMLQLVFDDIFNPNGSHYLDPIKSYGGDNCKTIVLIDRGGGYTLNQKYTLNVNGCGVSRLSTGVTNLDIPAVGIDIRRLEMVDGVGYVSICIFSCGSKRIIGGCIYRYEIRETNGRWAVILIDAFDP